MSKYIVTFTTFKKDGTQETATAGARTVRECADMAYMILTAQYQDANAARADANSVERQFKEWRNKRAVIILAGVFSLTAHVSE